MNKTCKCNAHTIVSGIALNSILSYDPTRTTTLRNKFAADLTKRFREIRQAISESIITNDCFGLITDRPVELAAIPRKAFAFKTSSEKVNGFMTWLKKEQDAGILEIRYAEEGRRIVGHRNWEKVYIDSAYKKGIKRANDEMIKAGIIKPTMLPTSSDFAIDAAFNMPVHADKVGLIYTRVFNELEGITQAMDQQISRELAEGLAEGLGPTQIAKNINNRVDKIGITRARTIARTEIIRAHHVATINTYREAGLEGVRVKAEWSTAGFGVCDLCLDMEAQGVYTLNEIEGLIPLHPNCLISGKVPIYTSKGWKSIKQIQIGDFVLTHKGRFRKVTNLHRTKRQSPDAVRIYIGSGYNASRLALTDNHPVLMDGKWIRADGIKAGMKIKYLADKCKRCGKLIPWYRKYCSRTCLSKDITDKQWANPEHRESMSRKASLQLKREYKLGIRDGDKITRKAHIEMRRMVKEGKCPLARPDVRDKIRLVTNTPEMREASSERMRENNPSCIPEVRERMTKSFNNTLELHPEKRLNVRMAKHRKSGSMTWIEQRMALLLDKIGIDYVSQYPILRYNVDFAIPALQIAIECDGEYWHQDKKKDQKRQKRIEAEGWFVLRFSGAKINQCLGEVESELLRLVSNHAGEFDFLEMKVVKVDRWKVRKPRMLYNLTVDKDESYIAHGFVVHNCRCVALPVVTDKVGREGEFFPDVSLKPLPRSALPRGVRLPPSRIIKAKPKPKAPVKPKPKSSAYYERQIKETQAKIDKLAKETAAIEKQLLKEDRARIAARKKEGKAIAKKRLPEPKPIKEVERKIIPKEEALFDADKEMQKTYSAEKLKGFEEKYKVGGQVGKIMEKRGWSENSLWQEWLYNGVEGLPNPEGFVDMGPVSRTFFMAGQRGLKKPVFARGWRYGKIPDSGVSWNFADDRPERGISMMAVWHKDAAILKSKTFELFTAAGEKKYVVKGFLSPFLGSDGEPLLVGARVVRKYKGI